jgi:CRP/FNR family transcriptional regulator, cyclic AMP receptor protein
MKKVLFILGELTDDDIDWMISIGKREEIAADTILIGEGQAIDTLYILLDGVLKVYTTAAGDKEIATLTSGEVVGEMSFVDSRPPSATVRAVESSLVLAIPRAQLAEKLQIDVGFASRFYRALANFLSDRLRITVSQLGYSKSSQLVEESAKHSMAPETANSVAIAETRLDWLMRRLKES